MIFESRNGSSFFHYTDILLSFLTYTLTAIYTLRKSHTSTTNTVAPPTSALIGT